MNTKIEHTKAVAFRWYAGGDSAVEHLCALALKDYLSQIVKGTKARDKTDRQNATLKLLSSLAAVGPSESTVAISLKVKPTPLPRYPRGHKLALEMLIAQGFVEQVTVPNSTGSKSAYIESRGLMSPPSSKPMKATAGTYRLSALAWQILHDKGFNTASLIPDKERSIIVNAEAQGHDESDNDNSPKVMAPPEHPNLNKWTEQTHQYNLLQRRFKFTLDGEQMDALKLDLRRMFNSADYGTGGRFYSAFVNMPGKDRKRLQVDGFPLVSLDYSSLFPRLAFAIAGLECPDGDLYHLEGHERGHVKLIWTSALGAANNSGFSSEANKIVAANGGNGIAILRAIKAKFPGIGNAMGRALSVFLQRAESCAVEVFIDGFTQSYRPLLPVHDGYYFTAEDVPLFESLRPKAEEAIYQYILTRFPEALRHPLPMS
jgi:hypothetical protein